MSNLAFKSRTQEIVSRTDLSDEQTSRWIVRSKQSSFLLVDLDATPRVGDRVAFKFNRENEVLGFTLFETVGKIDVETEV